MILVRVGNFFGAFSPLSLLTLGFASVTLLHPSVGLETLLLLQDQESEWALVDEILQPRFVPCECWRKESSCILTISSTLSPEDC